MITIETKIAFFSFNFDSTSLAASKRCFAFEVLAKKQDKCRVCAF